MARQKTPHRLLIEAFLADTGELRDDWLSLPYTTRRECGKLWSTAYQLKRHGYPIVILENDSVNKVIWIWR